MRGKDAGAQDNNNINNATLTPTILLLIWTTLTTIWAIFTPPTRTFAIRILIFQPAWAVRIWLGDGTWRQDATLALLLHAAYSYILGWWRPWTLSDLAWLDPTSNSDIWLYIHIFSLLAVCGALAGGIVHRGHQLKDSSEPSGPTFRQAIDEHLLPPLLIASRTTHTRQFPQKHSFSYPYLMVGVPVGLHGRISNALSVDAPHRAWFDVRSADFLTRDKTESTLGEKLKRWLHSQGVTDRDYAFAYLVTAPRFLGYSFNPVSFWYLYDSDVHLKYMILEVNNTFDERHVYLLNASTKDDDADDSTSNDGRVLFKQSFPKSFHVSPFNSLAGTYSLRATDPLASHEKTGHVTIDNTIVLSSSQHHPKIVARVYSNGPPHNATTISFPQLTAFIFTWCLTGFLTFPRILYQANLLFFRKHLPVFYRPEPHPKTIARASTPEERHLENLFRAFLQDILHSSHQPLRLLYKPPHPESDEIAIYSPGFTYEEDSHRTLTLHVTSPAFYSRFIHYAHASEAFDREGLATDERNRTIAITSPELLPILLEGMKVFRPHSPPNEGLGLLERWRWGVLKRLRCPPGAVSYPAEAASTAAHSTSDIRSFHFSELDGWMMGGQKDDGEYRRIAVKLFLAERFAGGFPALIDAADVLFRSVLLIASMTYSRHAAAFDVFRAKGRYLGHGEWRAGLLMMGLANAVHIWRFIKG